MTYIDSAPLTGALHGGEDDAGHSWADFTRARMDWLYGAGRAASPQAQADVAAWNRLGDRQTQLGGLR